jgi:hypothetical protein
MHILDRLFQSLPSCPLTAATSCTATVDRPQHCWPEKREGMAAWPFVPTERAVAEEWPRTFQMDSGRQHQVPGVSRQRTSHRRGLQEMEVLEWLGVVADIDSSQRRVEESSEGDRPGGRVEVERRATLDSCRCYFLLAWQLYHCGHGLYRLLREELTGAWLPSEVLPLSAAIWGVDAASMTVRGDVIMLDSFDVTQYARSRRYLLWINRDKCIYMYVCCFLESTPHIK